MEQQVLWEYAKLGDKVKRVSAIQERSPQLELRCSSQRR
jgi:hypothetical protein